MCIFVMFFYKVRGHKTSSAYVRLSVSEHSISIQKKAEVPPRIVPREDVTVLILGG
jgi:hypothetical protein